MNEPALTTSPPLTAEGCAWRKDRLRDLLDFLNLDAALFSNRHYVYALTGYWHASPLTPVLCLIDKDGRLTLVTPGDPPEAPGADECLAYTPHKLCTLVENLEAAAAEVLRDRVAPFRRIGTDGVARPWISSPGTDWIDLTAAYQELRRGKAPDEIEALRFTLRGAHAAYTAAREAVAPGLTERELYVTMESAAARAAGEPLSGWGNDFQSNSPGGPARARPMKAGELVVLDIGVGVRGYRSDLCRTFAVDRSPSEAQLEAHARVVEALKEAERLIRPGARCRDVFETIHGMLEGWKGYRFFHHLGHGIGLDAHEVPRINPEWDDVFEAGDVVAVEPGLYGPDLKAGIRLEENFAVGETGVEKLSNYPLEL